MTMDCLGIPFYILGVSFVLLVLIYCVIRLHIGFVFVSCFVCAFRCVDYAWHLNSVVLSIALITNKWRNIGWRL
jgi:hypothetical protein